MKFNEIVQLMFMGSKARRQSWKESKYITRYDILYDDNKTLLNREDRAADDWEIVEEKKLMIDVALDKIEKLEKDKNGINEELTRVIYNQDQFEKRIEELEKTLNDFRAHYNNENFKYVNKVNELINDVHNLKLENKINSDAKPEINKQKFTIDQLEERIKNNEELVLQHGESIAFHFTRIEKDITVFNDMHHDRFLKIENAVINLQNKLKFDVMPKRIKLSPKNKKQKFEINEFVVFYNPDRWVGFITEYLPEENQYWIKDYPQDDESGYLVHEKQIRRIKKK